MGWFNIISVSNDPDSSLASYVILYVRPNSSLHMRSGESLSLELAPVLVVQCLMTSAS